MKYAGTDTAVAALAELKNLSKAKTVKLKDAVAITKTEKGKVKLHQAKDDSGVKGFFKGGALGIVFGLLFAAPAMVLVGAVSGTAVGMFDKGIKDKLLKGLGDDMSTDESALAVLIEKADWGLLLADMDSKFSGETIVEEFLPEHMAEIDALTENAEIVSAVPEEINL